MGKKGRTQVQNIMKVKPGPTSYLAVRVQAGSPLSAFRIFWWKYAALYSKMHKLGERATNSCKNAKIEQLQHVLNVIYQYMASLCKSVQKMYCIGIKLFMY